MRTDDLETNHSDILIIGGGVIGLSIARSIRRRSAVSITVVDSGRAGCEASWAAAGMLAPYAEPHSNEALQEFCIRANDFYPLFAEELEAETGATIDLEKNGTVEIATNADEAAKLESKFRDLRAKSVNAELVSKGEIRRLESSVNETAERAIFYADEGQVDNRLLVSALRTFAERNDISIVEGVPIREFIVDGDTVRGALSDQHRFEAEMTIAAAGAWSSPFIDLSSENLVVRPIRGQMIGFQAPERIPKRVIYGARGYVVGRRDGRVIVGATVEDVGFERSVDPDTIRSLSEAGSDLVPGLRNLPLVSAWAGLRPMAWDGLPLIGWHPSCKGAFIATGHFRNGILLAPLTGEIVADFLMNGVASRFIDAFAPSRLRERSSVASL